MEISKKKARITSKMKQTSGITLVALVVTIVILIILATVSINAVLRRKWDYTKGTASKGIA